MFSAESRRGSQGGQLQMGLLMGSRVHSAVTESSTSCQVGQYLWSVLRVSTCEASTTRMLDRDNISSGMSIQHKDEGAQPGQAL